MAKYPVNLDQHIYTNNTQQDSFLFFIELRNTWPKRINDLFSFTIHIKRVCQNCQNVLSYDERNARHISKNLSERSITTDFYSKFKSNSIGDCTNCCTETMQEYTETYNIPVLSKYMIVYTSLFSWTQHDTNGSIKINSKLTGYDPDNIILPGQNDIRFKYKIIAAIIRSGPFQNSGHYTIWVRHMKENSWLHINDIGNTYCAPLLNSGEFLNDIQFMILKKE